MLQKKKFTYKFYITLFIFCSLVFLLSYQSFVKYNKNRYVISSGYENCAIYTDQMYADTLPLAKTQTYSNQSSTGNTINNVSVNTNAISIFVSSVNINSIDISVLPLFSSINYEDCRLIFSYADCYKVTIDLPYLFGGYTSVVRLPKYDSDLTEICIETNSTTAQLMDARDIEWPFLRLSDNTVRYFGTAKDIVFLNKHGDIIYYNYPKFMSVLLIPEDAIYFCYVYGGAK